MLNSSTPRSIRQKRLRRILNIGDVNPNLRVKILEAWELHESEHLRRSRILKWKAKSSVQIGDYEVIKILGKGSFGVVRLVKDKTVTCPIPCDGTASNSSLSRRSSMAILVKGLGRRKHLSAAKKDVFAMKVIKKADMIRNAQEGHIRAERDFLVAADGSKWVIPLLAAFQDNQFLYLVMEYCIGGDFLSLLIRKNILSEEITKWYIAEMILCVEEAHRMRWIHRDVKPDNFLIGADGHLKISDFGLAFDGGWQHDQKFYHTQRHSLLEKLNLQVDGDAKDQQDDAKHPTAPDDAELANTCKYEEPLEDEKILDWRNRAQRRKLARSVVGTSQYMAPEVIRGDMYDGRCDWWSIGIIMYECLYGFTPFACEDRQSTKLKILKHKSTLQFPDCGDHGPSTLARDLILRLLVEKEERLCTNQYDLNDYTRKTFGGYSRLYYADKTHRDYAGYFVYEDDAKDIKRHDFFKPIPWESMNIINPPFVPRVKGWADTKYFDNEGSVSDIEISSSAHEIAEKEIEEQTVPKCEHQPEAQTIVPAVPQDDQGEFLTNGVGLKDKRIKEKKRPRDKILRDPVHSRIAMKMRKEGAFLGYEYRKAKEVEDIVQQVLHENDQTKN